MATQAEAYRDDRGTTALALAHPGLPDDLANFHHDPLAVAVATGWAGRHGRDDDAAAGARRRRRTLERTSASDPAGRQVDLVVDVDGPAFAEHWLRTVEALRGTS